MYKSYRYRLYPDKEQQIFLEKHFGCVRWLYNWGLDYKSKLYKETKENIGWMDLVNKIPKLKIQYPWLKEVSANALVGSLSHLGKAYQNFFEGRSNFPKFKIKYNKQSYNVEDSIKPFFNKNKIQIPKFYKLKTKDNRIKCIFHRKYYGKIKFATICKDKSGKYFISLLVDDSKELPTKQPINKALGLDFGLKTFITTSDGTKINSPEFLKQNLKKLAKAQRKLCKKKLGSKNRQKQQIKVARLHEKISNKRQDFLHKLSHKLICKNQADTICIEDLSMQNMQQNKNWSRKISDLSWFELTRQLQYKADWYGKNLIKIGRFEPSSKMCSKCGQINNIELSDRVWVCSNCGVEHDRDINAAKNILDFGMNKYQLGRDPTKVKPVENSNGLREIESMNQEKTESLSLRT
jgi:putative transposase